MFTLNADTMSWTLPLTSLRAARIKAGTTLESPAAWTSLLYGVKVGSRHVLADQRLDKTTSGTAYRIGT